MFRHTEPRIPGRLTMSGSLFCSFLGVQSTWVLTHSHVYCSGFRVAWSWGPQAVELGGGFKKKNQPIPSCIDPSLKQPRLDPFHTGPSRMVCMVTCVTCATCAPPAAPGDVAGAEKTFLVACATGSVGRSEVLPVLRCQRGSRTKRTSPVRSGRIG